MNRVEGGPNHDFTSLKFFGHEIFHSESIWVTELASLRARDRFEVWPMPIWVKSKEKFI